MLAFQIFKNFIYLLISGCAGFSLLCVGFSVAVESPGGYSLVVVLGLLIMVASLIVSTGCRHVGFSSCGSWALEHRLNSWGARIGLAAPRHVGSSRTRD